MGKFLFKLKIFLLGWFIRDRDLIVISSAHNNFTGNCKYAVKAIQDKFPNKKIIWCVQTEQQATELQKLTKIKTVIYGGEECFKIIAKAKYILSDGCFISGYYTNGTIQIDFWHGGKIKKIMYDARNGQVGFKQIISRWLNRKNWIASGTSLFDVNVYCDAQRLNRKMGRVLGTPCIAPLVDKNILQDEINNDKKLTVLNKQIAKYSKVFLYAPTFRDSGADFLQGLNFDIQKLQSVCEQKNILFLIKMHPLCNLNITNNYSNVKILDMSYDATIVVAMCDVVVSDYSSMTYHAMAGGKELVYMHGDIAQYRKNNRDIYDWVLSDMKGHKVSDFNDLYKLIKNNTPIKPVPQKIFNKYFDRQIIDEPYKFLEVFK